MIRHRPFRLLVACAVLALAGFLLRGYVTDDTFIHLRYAENLLERGEFSFNPGQATYGATSPLWVGGLLVLLELGLAPLTAAWVLGAVSGLLVLLLMDALLAGLRWPDRLKWWWPAALLWLTAADAWFLRWTFSGMETPLATALLLLLLFPLRDRDGRPLDWRRYLAWGVAAGLGGLVRPEIVLLGPAALPWLLWLERKQGGRQPRGLLKLAGAAGAGWLMALAPWLLFSLRLFGRLFPETASAKSYGITLAVGHLLSSAGRSVAQLAATGGFLWLALLILAVVCLLVRCRPAPTAAGDGNPAGTALVGIALTWTVLLVGGYAVKQVWVISRYLSPLSPVLLLAVAVLAARLLRRLLNRPRWLRAGAGVLVLGCLVSLLANGWLVTAKVRPHARDFSRGVRECYLATGHWLRENSAPDAVVAALDIGAVGYGSERFVLDLMGLVSPEILAVGRQVGFEEMVESGAWLEVAVPDYLVDRNLGPPRWAGREVRRVRFELLRSCLIEGVGLREPQPWTVALYRLSTGSGAD